MLPDKMSEIHPSIIKAICRVQAALTGSIKQDGRNQHGGYKYASTDAVYAALTLKLAEAGLTILAVEEHEPETKRVDTTDKKGDPKIQLWGRFAFGFILATEEASWYDPKSRRSLFIQITGPQTFMAAESYAMKAFLRSLFKLPTGDQDLDSMPQEIADHESAPRKSSYAANSNPTEKKRFSEAQLKIARAVNSEDLQSVWNSYADGADGWAGFPPKWAELLEADFCARMDDLRQAELV